jgi:hypothetical protein
LFAIVIAIVIVIVIVVVVLIIIINIIIIITIIIILFKPSMFPTSCTSQQLCLGANFPCFVIAKRLTTTYG